MVALVRLRLDRHLCGLVTTLCVLVFTSANESWAQTANQAQLTREQAPSAFPSTVPPSGAEGGNVAAAPGDADLGEQQILKRTDDPTGRFAWIMDPEGNKIELWEPKRAATP